MPAVSVLLPVYNGEAYIAEAVNSILQQTFTHFCLYVLDDGSTDATLAIVESFRDDRIKVIKNESNNGLIATLNNGLDVAVADGCTYIARMDADDISLPQRFEKQVAFMEANPGIGLCGTWVEEFTETGASQIKQLSTLNEAISAELFFQNTIWHPSVMIKADIIKTNHLRYEAQFLHAEDYALWWKMSALTKLANIGEVLLRYRVHNANVSVLYKEKQRQTCVAINQLTINHLLAKASFLNDEKRKSLSSNYIALLENFADDASRISKNDILLFKALLQINKKTGLYNDLFFQKALADFVLQYWSLWYKKYSFKTFTLLFVWGRFFSKRWPLTRQIITAGKCLTGWRSRS